MFEALVNQLDTMTLAEGLHTLGFTAFLVGGTVCCFVSFDKDEPSESVSRTAEAENRNVKRKRAPPQQPPISAKSVATLPRQRPSRLRASSPAERRPRPTPQRTPDRVAAVA